VPSNYTFLEFQDFQVFKPTAPELENLISKHDLNCAASSPNALYGARALPSTQVPTIRVNDTFESVNTQRQSFTLHSMKIKPLDMPFAHASLHLRGTSRDNETVTWTVDFPAGFHAMLDVDIASFSGNPWNQLRQLELWSDFHNGYTMDWEFCLDDLKVSLDN
jgi:hypothetical protein